MDAVLVGLFNSRRTSTSVFRLAPSTTTQRMKGVALAGTAGVPVGRFVHHETSDWTLTSDHPLEFVQTCDDESLYNHNLPGRLGMFLYPLDVRFHMNDRTVTKREDFDTVVRAERIKLHRETTVNMKHLSVYQDTDDKEAFVSNEESLNDSDVDERDDEEEGEECELDTSIAENCVESDDDNDA